MLCWSQGEGETGKGGDDEAESGYPGADVVELVNLRGDTMNIFRAVLTREALLKIRFILNRESLMENTVIVGQSLRSTGIMSICSHFIRLIAH